MPHVHSAQPPMSILQELRAERPDLLDRHEVYIDGGVTRGTDVLKALCLGAKGVGLGRAFLYANALWGEDGCRRTIESACRFILLVLASGGWERRADIYVL